MQGLRGNVRTPGEESANPQTALLNLLESEGLVGVVATNCDQEYDRMLHLGDRLMTRSVIDSVSEEKATGLGIGTLFTLWVVPAVYVLMARDHAAAALAAEREEADGEAPAVAP